MTFDDCLTPNRDMPLSAVSVGSQRDARWPSMATGDSYDMLRVHEASRRLEHVRAEALRDCRVFGIKLGTVSRRALP